MPKYYYTDPIKVLHMMKNFGAEFEIPNEDFDDQDDGFAEPYFDFRLLEIESPETINTLLDMLENGGRIYVKKESEFIFEPKKADFILLPDIESFVVIDEVKKVFDNGNIETVSYQRPFEKGKQIIMRDNKHFFMPEVEND